MLNLVPSDEIISKFPQNLLPSLQMLKFVCPKCRGILEVRKIGYNCDICEKVYLLHDGIPDFRIFPDPFLTYEQDYERTEIVIAQLENLNFEKLLEYYWSFSDVTPVVLRPKFIRSSMLGEHRARQTLELIQDKTPHAVRKVLEIGSGTGNFLCVAANSFDQIIGIDIAMRWLHLSRRRFLDAGIAVPPLICCNAEFLPFANNTFDLVVTSSTLEFVNDQPKVLAECSRVLNRQGTLYINSVNRFSIAKDPYSYLWGVGFLPRKWQARYVKWRSSASYENVKTLSFRNLDRLIEKHFLEREFILPDVSPAALKEFSFILRIQIKSYQFLKKRGLFQLFLKRFGPGWDVILRKNSKNKA